MHDKGDLPDRWKRTPKDKPVLISTLTDRSKVFLTFDLGDFVLLLGTQVYGTLVTTPRDFLVREKLG